MNQLITLTLGLWFELVLAFLVLVCLSLVSWIYLLKPSARKWYTWGTWRSLRPRNKEEKALEHSISLAIAIIMALVSTTILIFVLIFGAISYI